MAAQHKSRRPGVVGYIRVSTHEEATSAFSYNAQRDAIVAECQRRGLPLLYCYLDQGPYGPAGGLLIQDRYGLAQSGLSLALDALADGRGSVLMVATLDLLAGPAYDASSFLPLAQRQGWDLVALDREMDITYRASLLTEEQRRIIGQRTAEALAIRKAQGVRLGRPPQIPRNVVAAILRAYEQGQGWSAIARVLNDAKVPTAQGGRRWYPSTVRAVVYSRAP
jgi:DNA invertase Pin-like site-specific DNA recombinase